MATRTSQLSLALQAAPRWGGWRRNAGRKPSKKSGVPHLTRGPFKKLPAHVTLRLRSDTPSLRSVRIVREIERTFAVGCERSDFRLVHYSLQGHHAHLIVEADDGDALGRGMKAIGARLARAVNRVAGRQGPVLADRYHHRLLSSPSEVHRALRYVLLNARRHAMKERTGRARDVRIDPASSGPWFDGWKREAAIRTEKITGSERPPVARPRLWLVTVGWRRHGLIDPADVPG